MKNYICGECGDKMKTYFDKLKSKPSWVANCRTCFSHRVVSNPKYLAKDTIVEAWHY